MDASHQLSCLVLDAIDLLQELLPPNERPRYLRLHRTDLVRLVVRSMALDTYLQERLFLE